MSSLSSSARAENSSAAAGGNVDADGDEGEGMHGKGDRKIGIQGLLKHSQWLNTLPQHRAASKISPVGSVVKK